MVLNQEDQTACTLFLQYVEVVDRLIECFSGWRWFEGEPPCNPWAFPEQAENGECFKCHVKIPVHKHAARPGHLT